MDHVFLVFLPNSDSPGLLTLMADGGGRARSGGVSVVSRVSLGGVSVVGWWHLGGVSVVSQWHLGGVLVVSWWRLGGVAVCLGAVSKMSQRCLADVCLLWCLGGVVVVSR